MKKSTIGFIGVLIIIIIFFIFLISSNPENEVKYTTCLNGMRTIGSCCPDGTPTIGGCAGHQKLTKSFMAIRTKQQYEGLKQGFGSSADVSACYYDEEKIYQINGECKSLSVIQDINTNYVINCECNFIG